MAIPVSTPETRTPHAEREALAGRFRQGLSTMMARLHTSEDRYKNVSTREHSLHNSSFYDRYSHHGLRTHPTYGSA